MKYIYYIIMILSVGLFLNSCESDENGKMPDDIKDANAGVLIIDADNTDPFINVSDPAAYQVKASVDLLFEGTFNKIDVVVVFNDDYTKQYVLTSVTSVPSDITITGQQIIDAVAELATAADIEEGDVFNLFTSIELSDGTYLPGFTITGDNAITPSVVSQMDVLFGGVANLVIGVPCEFVLSDYIGVMDYSEFWTPDLAEWQVEVYEDPDYTGPYVGLIIDGIFMYTGDWKLKFEISTYDYSVKGLPASQVMAPAIFGYQQPTWSKMAGSVNTCTGTVVINVGSFCVSVGCFGDMPIVMTFKKAPPVKKSAEEMITDYGFNMRPFLRIPE